MGTRKRASENVRDLSYPEKKRYDFSMRCLMKWIIHA